MKLLPGLAILAFGLSLAACGKNDGGSVPTGGPVAAVAPPAGTTWADTITETPDGHFIMGNPKAKVHVAEYGSYTCSHCRDFNAESGPELRELVNTGKMSFELRNFVRDPLDISTALLARCGGKDIFYPLSDQFFGNQNAMFEKAQALGDPAYQAAVSAPPQQRFVNLAQATGLIDFAMQRGISQDQAKQCLADTAAAEKLAKGVQKANESYQISGTPSFLINDVLVDNVTTWSALKAKLKESGI